MHKFCILLIGFLTFHFLNAEIAKTEEHVCTPPVHIKSHFAKRVKIPRRLFQTWKTHHLPENFALWSQTWKTLHPSWEFELWDDDENRNFIAQYFPWFLERYNSYSKEIYRADAVRYFYLYQFGGIYADLDFECLKSFEPLLEEGCVILGRMRLDKFPHSIPNALMIAPPRADFWLLVIHHMLQASNDWRPEYATGPVILRQAAIDYRNKSKRKAILEKMRPFFPDCRPIPLQLRPPCELYPLDWTTQQILLYPCAYAITWWTHTWE